MAHVQVASASLSSDGTQYITLRDAARASSDSACQEPADIMCALRQCFVA